ncbi:MAG: protein kinase [Planctomycetes bacterium]|nr:protein kinase [Planctomycetota bacterium]
MNGRTDEQLNGSLRRVNEELKLIPPERLAEAEDLQRKEQASGAAPRSLIDILRAQGILDESTAGQLRALVGDADSSTSPKSDESTQETQKLHLGQILMAQGLITEAEVRECLELQAKNANQPGQPTRLGEILVQRGYVSEEQIRQALIAQKRKILYCPRCAIHMNVEVRTEVATYCCGTCQTSLVEPSSERQINVVEGAVKYVLRDPLPAEVEAAARKSGNRFGKYIIVSELGAGGIGVVHKAWDTFLGQFVALKRPTRTTPNQLQSLIKEARSLVLLRHANIVSVYDIGQIDGQLYMSMEYIEGRTLAEELRMALGRGEVSPLYDDPPRFLRFLRDVAHALQYAHSLPSPFVHCDLKPSNILIDHHDRAVVVDFGLAHKMRSFQDPEAGVSGTPSYMAPEQASGRLEDIDARTDVYGLGAILYELLTGRPPFIGSVQSVLSKAIMEQPDPPSVVNTGRPGEFVRPMPRIPRTLEELCLKCLEKDRVKRWQTAGDVAEALERILKAKTFASSMGPASAPAPPSGEPPSRKTIAHRSAYVYLRRRRHPESKATSLAALAFTRIPPGVALRQGLLAVLAALPAEGAESSAARIDVTSLEDLLPFFPPDADAAFSHAWATETARTALSLFHAECERTGKRDLYVELYNACRWGSTVGVGGRAERRTRRRFREILRDLVAQTVKSPDVVDEELRALMHAFPPAPCACNRCGGTFDLQATSGMYGGLCPRCVLQVGLDPAPPLEQVGPYEILGPVSPAEPDVYRARREEEAQEVRLRLLPDRRALDPARAAMRLRHRAALTVLDAGETDGHSYVVTEAVEGQSLKEATAQQPLPRLRAIAVTRAVAEAVQLAHEAGLVHGSLDPSKVILDRKGEPHVDGFGRVRASGDARAADVTALGEILARCLGDPMAAKRRMFAGAAEFIAALDGKPSAKPAAPQTPLPRTQASSSKKRLIVAAVIAVPLLAGGALLGAGILRPGRATSSSEPEPLAAGDHHGQALNAILAKAAQRRDLDECARFVEAHRREWPKDVHGHWLAAYVELQRGRTAKAEEYARQAVQIDAAASPAWRIIGLARMEQLDFPAAREALTKARTPCPRWELPRLPSQEADDLLTQGLLAYAQGDLTAAYATLEKATEKLPSPEGYRWLGVTSGDPQANARWQSEALKLSPDYAPALVERGIAYAALQEWDAALADLDRALERLPENGRAFLHRGIARAARDKLKDAEADLTRAVDLLPGEMLGWLERAKVRGRQGNHKGAFDDASQVVKLNPMLAEGHLERGRAQWNLGERDEAELDLDDALRLDPRLRGEVERIQGKP